VAVKGEDGGKGKELGVRNEGAAAPGGTRSRLPYLLRRGTAILIEARMYASVTQYVPSSIQWLAWILSIRHKDVAPITRTGQMGRWSLISSFEGCFMNGFLPSAVMLIPASPGEEFSIGSAFLACAQPFGRLVRVE